MIGKRMFGRNDEVDDLSPVDSPAIGHDAPLDKTGKNRWDKMWPVMAAGAGLFSDGYINNV